MDSVTLGSILGGVFGVIILVLDIYFIVKIIQNDSMSTISKILWILLILFFPVLGAILAAIFT